jgi:hypothetical protein
METVEAQQEVIQKAGLERQAQSGLSAFLSQTQFEGYVSVSWNWNFRNPDDTAQNGGSNALSGYHPGVGANAGALGGTAPYHSHHNSIQLDQFFLSMAKPATAESRGGFQVDLAFGEAAEVQANGRSIWALPNDDIFGGDDSDVWGFDSPMLYQAYVEYLAPIGNGISIKMGRMETLIGVESFRDDRNWNITRGLLWALQPVNHQGLLVSGKCECGFVWALGAVNGYALTKFDRDNEKAFIGRVGYESEMFSFLVNGYWGGDVSDLLGSFYAANGPGTSDDEIGIIDAILTVDPLENLSAYVNFDYFWTADGDFGGGGPISSLSLYGLAAGARLQVTDAMGVALRYDWVVANDFFFGGPDATAQEITGTIDYALTDNLTLRLEGRYDWISAQGTPDDFFVASSTPRLGGFIDPLSFTSEDQAMALVQMLYRF